MAYNPPTFKNQITLPLSRNESRCVIEDLDQQLADLGEPFVSRYPSHLALQQLIAEWIGVDEGRIVVTAGGDESLDRVMRLSLAGNRKQIVSHVPSFEMIEIYARNHGGSLDTVAWLDGDFPVDQLISKIDSETALVVVVSPNNPTGGLVSADQIERIAEVARSAGAKLLLDHAYIEFADTNPTEHLLANDNIMILRTFSKAFGLAGLRVGYLVAPTTEFASTVRDAAGPFPVSAVSLETARRALADYQPQMEANLNAVKAIRSLLHDLIVDCGGQPLPSQGNFILAEFEDHEAVWSGLAEDGVGVRKFVGNPWLDGRLRITCPVLPAEFLQLAQSLCRISRTDFEPYKSALGRVLNPDHVVQADRANLIAKMEPASQADRTWSSHRQTKETNIELNLNLDGTGKIEIETGIGFLDHMLTALAFHAGMDLSLKCDGDLYVDDHHTAEDCALALGSAIDQALGKRTGIRRFGYAYAPLDEALARTVIDLSGRPWPEIHLHLQRERVGEWACENITHFFQSLAMTLKCSLHIDVLRGTNDHHRAEAAFKSCAKALREAITKTAGAVPSTKGTLDD